MRENQRLAVVYHPCEAWYITNTKCCISSNRKGNARRCVMRYKGGLPPLMIYAALGAAMICQACGLDKKRTKPRLRSFLCNNPNFEILRPPGVVFALRGVAFSPRGVVFRPRGGRNFHRGGYFILSIWSTRKMVLYVKGDVCFLH